MPSSCPAAVLCPTRTWPWGWLVPAAAGVHGPEAAALHAPADKWPRYFSCCRKMKPGSTRGQGQSLIPWREERMQGNPFPFWNSAHLRWPECPDVTGTARKAACCWEQLGCSRINWVALNWVCGDSQDKWELVYMMMLFFSRCLQAVPVHDIPLGGEDRSVPLSFDSDFLLQTCVSLGCHELWWLCPGCLVLFVWERLWWSSRSPLILSLCFAVVVLSVPLLLSRGSNLPCLSCIPLRWRVGDGLSARVSWGGATVCSGDWWQQLVFPPAFSSSVNGIHHTN